MYIKVEVEFLDTIVYKINADEILIGSGDFNHIVFKLPSISRKHVKIFNLENKWFVSDVGSTNGTYLSDQKLGKGKQIELLPGETIRLGDMVFLTLLSRSSESVELPIPRLTEDEDTLLTKSDENKTQVVSLTALEKARLNVARKKRKQIMEKRAENFKRRLADKKNISRVLGIMTIVLLIGWGANRFWITQLKKVESDTIIKKMQTKFGGDLEIEADLEGFRIPRKALISRNKLAKLLLSPKCRSKFEQDICHGQPLFSIKDSGLVYLPPKDYIFFLDQKSYDGQILSMVEQDDKPSEKGLIKFSFLNFFKDYLQSKDFGEDGNVYVVFFKTDMNERMLITYVAAYDHSKSTMISSALDDIKFPGPYHQIDKALTKLDSYFTVY